MPPRLVGTARVPSALPGQLDLREPHWKPRGKLPWNILKYGVSENIFPCVLTLILGEALQKNQRYRLVWKKCAPNTHRLSPCPPWNLQWHILWRTQILMSPSLAICMGVENAGIGSDWVWFQHGRIHRPLNMFKTEYPQFKAEFSAINDKWVFPHKHHLWVGSINAI